MSNSRPQGYFFCDYPYLRFQERGGASTLILSSKSRKKLESLAQKFNQEIETRITEKEQGKIDLYNQKEATLF